MMNSIKKFIFGSLVCLLGLMYPLSATYSNTGVDTSSIVTCPQPTVSLAGQGSDSFSFSVAAASGTTVQYWVVKNGGGSGAVKTVSGSSVTISGLTAGTYTVYFEGVCDGSRSDIIIFDDLIM
jgi:hypothetical protein